MPFAKPYSVGAQAVELKLIWIKEVNIQLDFSYYRKCFHEDEENFTALSWPPNSPHLISAISTKQGSSIILNYDKWQFCWCFLWIHLHPEFSHWGYHLSCVCFSFFELVWIDFSYTICSVTIGFMFGLLIHIIQFINNLFLGKGLGLFVDLLQHMNSQPNKVYIFGFWDFMVLLFGVVLLGIFFFNRIMSHRWPIDIHNIHSHVWKKVWWMTITQTTEAWWV